MIDCKHAKVDVRRRVGLDQVQCRLTGQVASILTQPLKHERNQTYLAQRIEGPGGGRFALHQSNRVDLLNRAAVGDLKIRRGQIAHGPTFLVADHYIQQNLLPGGLNRGRLGFYKTGVQQGQCDYNDSFHEILILVRVRRTRARDPDLVIGELSVCAGQI